LEDPDRNVARPHSSHLGDLIQKKYKITLKCLEYKESVDHPNDKELIHLIEKDDAKVF
jgi:hypothetical protein